jgi:integrase
MARPLTPISIKALRPRTERYEVADPGCAGLKVVVFPSGAKSFVCRFRVGGRQRKLTLGPCLIARDVIEVLAAPEPGAGPLSLASARALCMEALRTKAAGRDPAAIKQQRRKEQHAAASGTFEAIARQFLQRKPAQRADGQLAADLELLYKPFAALPINALRRSQIVEALDAVEDGRGPVRADRVLTSLSRLFGWYAGRDDYFTSPLRRGMRRTSVKERARSRVLSDDELRRVWRAAEKDNTPFGPYLQFTLLAATRRGEAAGLRRSELSDDGRTWIIPGSRYKSGKDVVIPLSKVAQQIVARQLALPGGDHVFSASGKYPLGDYASRKAAFDRACGVNGWRIHDLRRTARTLLSRAEINADVAEMCLGHAPGNGVRQTYDRFEYLDAKRHAFETLAALVGRIVRPPKAAVADLAAERGRRSKRKSAAT